MRYLRSMALIPCPECKRHVSDLAPACPGCGCPLGGTPTLVASPRKFAGPPKECSHCGGELKRGAKAVSEGTGCLVAVFGLVLTPVLIGIPLLLYGLHLSNKREGFWRCRKCDALFPREIKWFDFG